MKYPFPVIQNIVDILPYIENEENFIITQGDNYSLISHKKGNKHIFDFDYDNPLTSIMRRECTGLVFDKEGKLIGRPFHKFFNLNEKNETKIDQVVFTRDIDVTYQLDGTMVYPVLLDEEYIFMTEDGETDISSKAKNYIKDRNGYSELIKTYLDNGDTPIFEWLDSENKNIIEYPEDILILTAVRNNKTGDYLSLKEISISASLFDIPVVYDIYFDEFGYFPKSVEELNESIKNSDNFKGIVATLNNGHRFKIQTNYYISKLESNTLKNRESENYQEILDFKTFSKKITESVSATAQKIFDIYENNKNVDGEEYIQIVENQEEYYKDFLYKIKNIKNPHPGEVKQMLLEYISNNTNEGSKNKINWIFEEAL